MKMIEQGRLIEPLNQLYKDEVRELGKLLGLPEKLVERHPFPGPGLAIRILCSNGVDETDPELIKRVKKLAMVEGFNAKLLPVKAVGVQGDNRTYSNAVLIQGKLDYELIEKASTKLTNSFASVNRVIFLLKPGNIETLELEKAFLSRERVERLRECDALAMKTVDEKGLGNEV